MEKDGADIVTALKQNKIIVMPTDTIYGVVGSALSASVVNRIYSLRRRDLEKPCIILIGDPGELKKFSITPSAEQERKMGEYWPGPVSIIFECLDENLSYLHRGTKTLAFRVPADEELRSMLMKSGPVLAPSANPEGLPPALSAEEAKKYFKDSVEMYVDGGELTSKASKVIKLHKDGTVTILRQ
ncbi:MAG: L-threonylcarbamoyladenylate synthase [Minisyncoccia bacterium]